MKIRNLLLTLTFTLMLSVTVLASVPYKSLYYDGANHAYTAEKIYLSINGVILDDTNLPLQPINLDGSRTLVPLREVFENLGSKVNFDSATNTVTVIDGNNTVVVTVGSTTGYIHGNAGDVDAAPEYVALDSTSGKKVMIPLRFVGEGLGYGVNYNATTRTVSIEKPMDEVTTNTVTLTEINSTTIKSSSESTAKLTEYTLPTAVNKSFVMKFDNPVSAVKKSTLTDGRLVVDVENAVLSTGALNQNVSIGTLSNVRLAQFVTTPTPITRSVLTFNEDTTYTVTLSSNRKTLTISFEDSGKTPSVVEEGLNATKVTYSTNGDADLFTIYGESETPELYGVTSADDLTLYIDVLKPNTLLTGTTQETVTGVSVSSYKVYDINDTTTRIAVTLNKKSINSVVQNGNLTKVYIKPVGDVVSSGDGAVIDSSEVLSVNTTTRTATIKINKNKAGIPSSFAINSITQTDKYMTYDYEISIPMGMSSVLPTQNIPIKNEILNSIDIVQETGKTRFLFNGENVLYAKVTEDSDCIIFTIKAARDVYDTIIVIDAGHGGTDPGTKGVLNGNTYYEKAVAIDMAKKAANYISADTRFKVYQTRPDDVFVQLYDRPAFSSKIQADMFISIHANSSTSSIPNGIDTFYFDVTKEDATYLATKGVYPTDYRKEVTATSKDFASAMQKKLISTTLLTDRSYKHADYAVLRNNDAPAILIETGFMSNQRDLINLVDDAYRTKVAKAIADTVIGYYGKY